VCRVCMYIYIEEEEGEEVSTYHVIKYANVLTVYYDFNILYYKRYSILDWFYNELIIKLIVILLCIRSPDKLQ